MPFADPIKFYLQSINVINMKTVYSFLVMIGLSNCLFGQGQLIVLPSVNNTFVTQTDNLMVIGTIGKSFSGTTVSNGLVISNDPPPLLLTGTITRVEDLPLIESLEVFPNPFISFVQLRCRKEKEDLIISVTGTNGINIASYEWKKSDDEFQFSLHQLPAGLYVINVTENGNKRASQFKLVKR